MGEVELGLFVRFTVDFQGGLKAKSWSVITAGCCYGALAENRTLPDSFISQMGKRRRLLSWLRQHTMGVIHPVSPLKLVMTLFSRRFT